MANEAQEKGFTIPQPEQSQPLNTQALSEQPAPGFGSDVPEPRDYAITVGILLVLLIAFFFAKNAYSNHLARKRLAPGAANAAGWWLFIFFTGLSTAVALSILSPSKFMTPIFMAPLLLISLVALVLMFITGRRT